MTHRQPHTERCVACGTRQPSRGGVRKPIGKGLYRPFLCARCRASYVRAVVQNHDQLDDLTLLNQLEQALSGEIGFSDFLSRPRP